MRRLLILVAMVLLISGSCMSAPQPAVGAGAIWPYPRHGLLGAPHRMLPAPPPNVLGDVSKNPGKPLTGPIMKHG
ncbi:hypothetical protein C0Q70_17447 [Pomacea canaliculata]|uniref:Uncharacterized protein n=1 Tax=Pomacea canaliculata TaxID=400727 RepID=A0A2T7NKF4_POMCA|nr:hypothetical protein C0Q70_17447 [Pomacea canaliculata]